MGRKHNGLVIVHHAGLPLHTESWFGAVTTSESVMFTQTGSCNRGATGSHQTAFVCVPPIILMQVGVPRYCPWAFSNTGISVCIFICPQNCFRVCVHVYLVAQCEKSKLLKGRRERWVAWSAGTPQPLLQPDWLPGLLADWQSPKGKQTSDLITNPIKCASYLQCEQSS